jgi:hypothetical protein
VSDGAAADRPVRLRGHHLLCVLTYLGRGYSPSFIAGLSAIAGRLAAGAPVEIVAGPDDVCAPLIAEEAEPHCLGPDPAERDDRALADIGALLGVPLAPGAGIATLVPHLDALRSAFADDRVRAACRGCSWQAVCSDIAASGFAGTHLRTGG